MRQRLIITLFFLCCYLPISSQEVTVATFNAEFLNKAKVHIKFGKSFDLKKEPLAVQDFWSNELNRTTKFKEASKNVAKEIKRINADILTLTEVGNLDEIKVLLSELNKIGLTYKYHEVCECTDYSTGQNVAVLSKYPLKEVWKKIEGRSLYLEELDGDSEGETGISKGLKVTVTVNKKDIDIFVLHLISERSGYESDAKRLAQANIARRAIIKQLNKGRKVIVTGDLNSEKRSESVYRLRGFDDLHEELIQTGLTKYFENTEVRWTYNYKGEPEQIDHILVSPGLTSRTGIKTNILEVTDKKISDHNPVIVKLKLR
jgi:endonuclease/exonuclease/phosphatase family metal-dependent hydrolase